MPAVHPFTLDDAIRVGKTSRPALAAAIGVGLHTIDTWASIADCHIATSYPTVVHLDAIRVHCRLSAGRTAGLALWFANRLRLSAK